MPRIVTVTAFIAAFVTLLTVQAMAAEQRSGGTKQPSPVEPPTTKTTAQPTPTTKTPPPTGTQPAPGGQPSPLVMPGPRPPVFPGDFPIWPLGRWTFLTAVNGGGRTTDVAHTDAKGIGCREIQAVVG